MAFAPVSVFGERTEDDDMGQSTTDTNHVCTTTQERNGSGKTCPPIEGGVEGRERMDVDG